MATSANYFFSHIAGFKRGVRRPEWSENGPRHAAWKIEAHDGHTNPTTFYIASLGLDAAIEELLRPDAEGHRFYVGLDVFCPATDNWRDKYSKKGWRRDGGANAPMAGVDP